MSLERLLAEIQERGERDLAEATAKFEADKGRILADRDDRIGSTRMRLAQQAEAEARREKTQRIAGARMQARKLEYEAQERALESSLGAVRDLLREFTNSDEYDQVLGRMYAYAVDQLGKDVRISGRSEDAAALKGAAGKSFDATPRAILGGLVAETADGERRLNLSLDELLRLREDKVRELLA
ncbi:MAG TPA: V-type ATP synthase subunit E family protein [Thermoplasmata archaeon]|nr:V-type ATP synthase subunit E family protein [Thermoplasmata archaeon]